MHSQVVMGLGGTVDYEVVWDSTVLERLVEAYGITSDEADHHVPVVDERSLVCSVLGFMAAGQGGERFVQDSALVEQFAARFERRTTLGGTPVRAAMAMLALGVPSTVHLVSIDDHVRRLLPPGVGWVCSASRDTTDPHLIVQLPAGAAVRVGLTTLVAPHPNRLIYANDPPNRELVVSDKLGPLAARADVFVVSGFNCIQEPDVLEERLATVRAMARSVPADGMVFYEDSGFHVPALAARVRDRLADAVDVWSMNEEELQAHRGAPVDLDDAHDVARALQAVRAAVPAAVLVVHTRCFAVAVGPRAEDYGAALLGGITMATTRYRCGDGFDADDYRTTAALPRHPGGTRTAGLLSALLDEPAVCEPAYLVDVTRPTTIGLGDTFVGGFTAALATAARAVPSPATTAGRPGR